MTLPQPIDPEAAMAAQAAEDAPPPVEFPRDDHGREVVDQFSVQRRDDGTLIGTLIREPEVLMGGRTLRFGDFVQIDVTGGIQ